MEDFYKTAADGMLGTMSEYVTKHPALIAGLLGAGGLGAIGGAALTGSEEDEDASARVKRRIKNALIGGALGAGSAAAIGYGLNAMGKQVPDTNAATANATPAAPTGDPTNAGPKDDGPSAGAIAGWLGAGTTGGAGAAAYTHFALNPKMDNHFAKDMTTAAKRFGLDPKTGVNAKALDTGVQELINSGVKDPTAKALADSIGMGKNTVGLQPSAIVNALNPRQRAESLAHGLSAAELKSLSNVTDTSSIYKYLRHANVPGIDGKKLARSMMWRNWLRRGRKFGLPAAASALTTAAIAGTPAIINSIKND